MFHRIVNSLKKWEQGWSAWLLPFKDYKISDQGVNSWPRTKRGHALRSTKHSLHLHLPFLVVAALPVHTTIKSVFLSWTDSWEVKLITFIIFSKSEYTLFSVCTILMLSVFNFSCLRCYCFFFSIWFEKHKHTFVQHCIFHVCTYLVAVHNSITGCGRSQIYNRLVIHIKSLFFRKGSFGKGHSLRCCIGCCIFSEVFIVGCHRGLPGPTPKLNLRWSFSIALVPKWSKPKPCFFLTELDTDWWCIGVSPVMSLLWLNKE